MKRQIFRVEQKTGKMPEIAWKTVLEREIIFCDDMQPNSVFPVVTGFHCVNTDCVMESLRYLYSDEQYRIILICD